MTTRKRKSETIYTEYKRSAQTGLCAFCQFTSDTDRLVAEYRHFWVVRNIYGYDIWENLDVMEHLMLIPKKHVDSLAKLSMPAQQEYGTLMATYEGSGYSLYARGVKNIAKSIPHQHTHLLQLGLKDKKFYFFLRKPYLLWYR